MGPGLDASARAFKALSGHFKDSTKKWLKEDKAAQKDRQAFPASMDIYDTVKEKGVVILRVLMCRLLMRI
jgi:hypothetical protein